MPPTATTQPTPPSITTPPPTPPTKPGECLEEDGCRHVECEHMGSCIEARNHTHDYWGDETRKAILHLESSLVPLPLFPCKKPGCSAPSDTYPAGTAIADYDIPAPPEGGLVYEGTDHLEVLLNWATVPLGGKDTPHPALTVMVDYLTASDEPGAFRTGGELKAGTPLMLPVAPMDADMPHQTKSLWVFRIYTKEPTGFDFNLTVTAVKGNVIANWPPHPDHYALKDEATILDAEQKISSRGSASYYVDGSDAPWQYPTRVISWGTDELEVAVTNVRFDGPGAPTAYVLEYHNASYVPKMGNGDQAGGRAEDPGATGGEYHFVVPVDEQGYDSPYGQASRWGFRFVPRYDGAGATCPAGTEALLAGCQWAPFTLTYHMTIVAKGHTIGGGG